MKVLAVGYGLETGLETLKQLETLGVSIVFQADARSALESVTDPAPDVAILMCKGPVSKWLFRVRQLAGRMPVALMHDSELSSSDVLRLLGSGVSALLSPGLAAPLVLGACDLIRAGFLVVPSLFGAKRIRELNFRKPALTLREVEVLRLVSQGKSNAEIAAELFIAEVTVRNHLSNIFKKTGFRNRTGAGIAFTLADLLSDREK